MFLECENFYAEDSPIVHIDLNPLNTNLVEDMSHVFDGCENFAEKSWVKVTATIKYEYFSDYEGEGPVLYAKDVAMTSEPEKPIIDFNA